MIQDELGYGEEAASEAERWNEQLEKLKLDVKIEEKVKREIAKFTKMAPSSAESGVIRNYVETILELPWNKSSRTNADLKKAERILNEDHYGLENLPETLRQMAEVRLENPDAPLKELGEYLDPPVGKSGVNHRLRKLSELADRIRT